MLRSLTEIEKFSTHGLDSLSDYRTAAWKEERSGRNFSSAVHSVFETRVRADNDISPPEATGERNDDGLRRGNYTVTNPDGKLSPPRSSPTTLRRVHPRRARVCVSENVDGVASRRMKGNGRTDGWTDERTNERAIERTYEATRAPRTPVFLLPLVLLLPLSAKIALSAGEILLSHRATVNHRCESTKAR